MAGSHFTLIYIQVAVPSPLLVLLRLQPQTLCPPFELCEVGDDEALLFANTLFS
jgi:hypothetical protein